MCFLFLNVCRHREILYGSAAAALILLLWLLWLLYRDLTKSYSSEKTKFYGSYAGLLILRNDELKMKEHISL